MTNQELYERIAKLEHQAARDDERIRNLDTMVLRLMKIILAEDRDDEERPL
jgi:uncharacterized coiled-coil protein SlyX